MPRCWRFGCNFGTRCGQKSPCRTGIPVLFWKEPGVVSFVERGGVKKNSLSFLLFLVLYIKGSVLNECLAVFEMFFSSLSSSVNTSVSGFSPKWLKPTFSSK
ncbi:unnamed protein product [Ixodes pacificus]